MSNRQHKAQGKSAEASTASQTRQPVQCFVSTSPALDTVGLLKELQAWSYRAAERTSGFNRA
jgi:hypothetical protein